MNTKKEIPLATRVSYFLQQHRLFDRSAKLLVAVSGGPDSVCLLHIMAQLCRELDIRLHVAHLDHRIRGAAAEEDARYVADLVRKLDLPATLECWDVPGYRRQHHLSLEEAAREVRYSFLAEVAHTVGAASVAVGHTRDDHVETVLMHLIRGSGTRGLRGLQPKSSWGPRGEGMTIIRPLLDTSRAETVAYCREHNLEPRVDASNLSLSPLRNRIRLELLPLLQKYNPRVVSALQRTARLADGEFAFFEEETERLQGEVCRKIEDIFTLDKERLQKLPPALQRHLLRRLIETLVGNLKDFDAGHIEDLLAALGKPAGKRITLPGGLTFSVLYDRYALGTDPAALAPFPELETETALKVPGTTLLPGWQVVASLSDRKQLEIENDAFTAFFDFTKVGDKIALRRRQPGDRFQPLGMPQTKKLSEFMIDAKIPQPWRKRVPLAAIPEQILWVVGYRIDERVKVTGATQRVLCLRMARKNG